MILLPVRNQLGLQVDGAGRLVAAEDAFVDERLGDPRIEDAAAVRRALREVVQEHELDARQG